MERLVLFNEDALYNIAILKKEAYYQTLTETYAREMKDVNIDKKTVLTKTPTEIITGILESKGYEGNPISMVITDLFNMYQEKLRELLGFVRNNPNDFFNPGVVDLLKELKRQKIDRGFFSSGNEDTVKRTMELSDLGQYFCVSGFYSDRDRTRLEVAHSTIEEWRASHEEILYREDTETTLVGNSPDDIEVGRSLTDVLKTKLIVVANGAYDLSELFREVEKSGLQKVYCVKDFSSYRDNARFIAKDA